MKPTVHRYDPARLSRLEVDLTGTVTVLNGEMGQIRMAGRDAVVEVSADGSTARITNPGASGSAQTALWLPPNVAVSLMASVNLHDLRGTSVTEIDFDDDAPPRRHTAWIVAAALAVVLVVVGVTLGLQWMASH